MGRIKIWKGSVEQSASSAGRETSRCIKRIPSRVFFIVVDKWGGRKSFSDSSRSRAAWWRLSRPRQGLSWCLVFTHAQTDRFPCWGVSQKFLVASLTVRDAVSPGRSCSRTSPATSRKCPAPLPGLEAGVSQHGDKIYCLSFLNDAPRSFQTPSKNGPGTGSVGHALRWMLHVLPCLRCMTGNNRGCL